MLEITLQLLPTPLEQGLNTLNLLFKVFQLVVLRMIVPLEVGNLCLVLLFFRSLDDLAVLVDQSAHCVFLPNLFNLRRVMLDFLPRIVDLGS